MSDRHDLDPRQHLDCIRCGRVWVAFGDEHTVVSGKIVCPDCGHPWSDFVGIYPSTIGVFMPPPPPNPDSPLNKDSAP